ncbi:hypothetical protein DY000_02045605 [Brassica cretica]|uniref:Uncharacterized protein n=1 Tax=Brassica cretica TaxID=69181 RepID=A0ABQ7EUU8_BRACR|nr:hypothetical protein DY000_02045605 [Brassica cretica]
MCGNEVRCFARFIAEIENLQGKHSFTIHTGVGLIIPEIQDDGQVPIYICYWGVVYRDELGCYHHTMIWRFSVYDNPRNGISIVHPVQMETLLIQGMSITKEGAFLEATSSVISFVAVTLFLQRSNFSFLYCCDNHKGEDPRSSV